MDSLRYDNAIYGQRGTTGGTRLTVFPDGEAWLAVIEPIWSDFPGEDDRWPEAPETLRVRWIPEAKATGILEFRGPRLDTAANHESIGDSLSLRLGCKAAQLLHLMRVGQLDTLHLERRRAGVWPY